MARKYMSELERAMLAAETELNKKLSNQKPRQKSTKRVFRSTKSFGAIKYVEFSTSEVEDDECNKDSEEAKSSPFLSKKPLKEDRKVSMCEKSVTERKFVYKTLKHYIRIKNLNTYHLVSNSLHCEKNVQIQEIRTRKNSVLGDFSRSGGVAE